MTDDTQLLDWLEQNATSGGCFTTFSIEFEVPDDYEGAETFREAIRFAMNYKDGK